MRHLVELSGESEELARAEAISVGRILDPGTWLVESDIRSAIVEGDFETSELADRLALAWSASHHIFSGQKDELAIFFETLEIPGDTFRVKVRRLGEQTPEEAQYIARDMGRILARHCRVDLDDPEVEIRILMGSKIHAGILAGKIDRSAMESRKSENRPFSHPISLHPKLARALVNLTGILPGQAILDPFCGTGGILLEAGLMGCRVMGGDIDQRMVDGSILNLEHYGIHDPDIRRQDISGWSQQVDAIATDPPYGRSASTGKEEIDSLYRRTFELARSVLKPGGKLAIVLPHEKYIELSSMEPELVQPVRVHRSLTRYFCLFRRPGI